MAGPAKLLLALLMCLLLTVVLLELSLPLFHSRYITYFQRIIDPSSLKAEEARRFFDSKTFDPDLGWDKDPIARNYVASKRYIAQSYGDSFVEGAEVGPEDTWQSHFERLTGKAILNFGVGGYGLDQAVLKFEKYGPHYPARIAILGLYPHTYRRNLSYHSLYYFSSRDDFLFAFKPIFIKRNGQFELVRPPCADAVCLMEVLSNPDNDVWRLLAQYDYWYQNNQEKPVPGFPNTMKYVQVIQQILQERRQLRGTEDYFFVNADSLDLVEYLIDRFVKDSRNMGMTPVCLLLYSPVDLRPIKAGIRLDNKLQRFLVAKNILHVDTAPHMLQQYQQDDDFVGLSAPNGHLNGRGNLMVAEALAKGLASMALLKG